MAKLAIFYGKICQFLWQNLAKFRISNGNFLRCQINTVFSHLYPFAVFALSVDIFPSSYIAFHLEREGFHFPPSPIKKEKEDQNGRNKTLFQLDLHAFSFSKCFSNNFHFVYVSHWLRWCTYKFITMFYSIGLCINREMSFDQISECSMDIKTGLTHHNDIMH